MHIMSMIMVENQQMVRSLYFPLIVETQKKTNFNFSFSPIMEIQWIQNDKQSRCIAIYRQMGVEKQ